MVPALLRLLGSRKRVWRSSKFLSNSSTVAFKAPGVVHKTCVMMIIMMMMRDILHTQHRDRTLAKELVLSTVYTYLPTSGHSLTNTKTVPSIDSRRFDGSATSEMGRLASNSMDRPKSWKRTRTYLAAQSDPCVVIIHVHTYTCENITMTIMIEKESNQNRTVSKKNWSKHLVYLPDEG